MSLNPSDRSRIITLIKEGKRYSEFRKNRPTKWKPHTVRKPQGMISFDNHFSKESAWDFIIELLENNEPVKEIELKKPQGGKGYVMLVELEANMPKLYIKFEWSSGNKVVFGRSFHYS